MKTIGFNWHQNTLNLTYKGIKYNRGQISFVKYLTGKSNDKTIKGFVFHSQLPE